MCTDFQNFIATVDNGFSRHNGIIISTLGIDFNQLISIVLGWVPGVMFLLSGSMTLCSYVLRLGKGRMERTVPTTVLLPHHQTRSIQTLR